MADDMGTGAKIRCSDADRMAAVQALDAHAAEGRLDPDEVVARTNAAFAAKTYGELAVLLADLPLQPPAPQSPPRTRRRLLHVSPLTRADAYIALLALTAFDAALYSHAWLFAGLAPLAALRLRTLVRRREPPPA
ncbi:MAG: DUF1707 SHOCT-like domain-containing protein [Acidimicrobiales bacterium]